MHKQEAMFSPQEPSQRMLNTDPREQSPSAFADEIGQETSYEGEQVDLSGGQENQQRPHGKKRSLKWLWTLIIIVVLLFGVANFVRDIQHDGPTVARTFTVQQVPHIKLDNYSGDVRVSVGDTHTVQVKATRQMYGLFQDENAAVEYRQNGNVIEIDVEERANSFFAESSVNLELILPATARVEIDSEHGDVAMAGISGQVDLQTSSGSVHLKDVSLSGPSQVYTDGGSIRLDHVNGQIDAKTSGGTVVVENSKLSGDSRLHTKGGNVQVEQTSFAGKVTARSDEGSISFQGSLEANGAYDFATNNGRIALDLPANGSYHLNATSSSGDIENEFESNSVGSGSKATVTASTKAGPIEISKD